MNLVKILKLYTVGVFCAFMSVIVHNSSLAQSSLPTCVPPPTGLVGWWSGDGNPYDIVGTNNGTLQNGATFVPGIVAQAFSFDGENDAIVVPDALDLNPIQQLTIEAWVFPTANSGSPGDVVGIIVNKDPDFSVR